MASTNAPGTRNSPLELRIERPNRGIESQALEVEKELLASVARVLEEAEANGVALQPGGGALSVEEVRSLSQRLAVADWEKGTPAGESPPRPLHGEHNGWGPPLDAAPEHPGKEQRVPWSLLAMDALDFLATAMGSADTLIWKREG